MLHLTAVAQHKSRTVVSGPIRLHIDYRHVTIDATDTAAQHNEIAEDQGIIKLSKAEALALLNALTEALKGTRR